MLLALVSIEAAETATTLKERALLRKEREKRSQSLVEEQSSRVEVIHLSSTHRMEADSCMLKALKKVGI